MEFFKQTWPWYISGPLLGLTVPLLLIFGNKMFGISSTLRHICAACIPSKVPYFSYDWKKETWNLVFALGIVLGGFIAFHYMTPYDGIDHSMGEYLEKRPLASANGLAGLIDLFESQQAKTYPDLGNESRRMFVMEWNFNPYNHPHPIEIFSWEKLFTPIGLIFMVLGGFLVGFGTRYANGCTSGHSIMGLAQLSPASLVATMGFFAGGLICSWFIVPSLIKTFAI